MNEVAFEDRIRIITEYETQMAIERIKNRMCSKPLSRARLYARHVTSCYSISEKEHIFDLIKKRICEKYGVRKVTDLDWRLYDEVNDYAIQLFDEKMTEDNYYCPEDYYTTIRNRNGYVKFTFDEWKAYCKDWASK